MIDAGHKIGEAELAASPGPLHLKRIALLVEQRESQASQAGLVPVCGAVVVFIVPYASGQRALDQHAVIKAALRFACRKREQVRIAVSAAHLTDGGPGFFPRMQDVSVQQPDAQLIRSRHQPGKGVTAVRVRLGGLRRRSPVCAEEFHLHAGKRSLPVCHAAVCIQILPDPSADRGQADGRRVDLRHRCTLGEREQPGFGYGLRGALRAVGHKAALRRGKTAVFRHGKGNGIPSGGQSFKAVAAVFLRHRFRGRFAVLRQQPDRKGAHSLLIRFAAGVRVPVLVDGARYRARHGGGDIQLPLFTGGKAELRAAAGPRRALRQDALRIAAAAAGLYAGGPPLARHFIRQHEDTGGKARKERPSLLVRRQGEAFPVLAFLSADEHDADAGKPLLVRLHQSVRLRVPKDADLQLCRNGRADGEPRLVLSRAQGEGLRAAGMAGRAEDSGMLPVRRKAECVRQGDLNAVFVRIERVKGKAPVRSRRHRPLRDCRAAGKAQERHLGAGKAVALLVQPDAAGNGSRAHQDDLSGRLLSTLLQRHLLRQFILVRFGQVAVRLADLQPVGAGDEAGEGEGARVVRGDEGRLILFPVEPDQLDADAAHALRRSVRLFIRHKALDAAGVQAARKQEIICMFSVDREEIGRAAARIRHAAGRMLREAPVMGIDHDVARVEADAVIPGRNPAKRIPAVRRRPHSIDRVSALVQQADGEPGAPAGLLRVQYAVAVRIQEGVPADRSVPAARFRAEGAVSGQDKGLLRRPGEAVLQPLPVPGRPVTEGPFHGRMHQHFSLRVAFRADAHNRFAGNKTLLSRFRSGFGIQVRDAQGGDVAFDFRKADRRGRLQRIGQLGAGRLPSAVAQREFHTRAI